MQRSKGPGLASPGDRPDSSTGRRSDHGHDADPHRSEQVGPGGHDDSEGMHSRDREGVPSVISRPSGVALMANVQDGQRLDRTGDKWFGDAAGEVRTELLLARLAKLTAIEADAIAQAIRQFWADPEVDGTAEWWLPAPRKEKAR
jgi:hypothetical protein